MRCRPRSALLQAAARVEVVEVESHYTVMQDEQAASAIRELLDRRVDLRAP